MAVFIPFAFNGTKQELKGIDRWTYFNFLFSLKATRTFMVITSKFSDANFCLKLVLLIGLLGNTYTIFPEFTVLEFHEL